MGYQNIRFGQRRMRPVSVEDEVRQTYDTARQTKRLGGRAAFMEACHAFSNLEAGVPSHLVPSHVARILNPRLNFQKRRRLQ